MADESTLLTKTPHIAWGLYTTDEGCFTFTFNAAMRRTDMALHRCIETISEAEKLSQDPCLLLSPFWPSNDIDTYLRTHRKASAVSLH